MAQCMVELNLPRCVRQMIITANDVGDGHFDIVNNDAEVVSRRSIRPGYDEIVDFAIIEDHRSFYSISNDSCPFLRRAKSNCVGCFRGQSGYDSFGGSASAVVNRFSFFLLSHLPLGVQFPRGADAWVSVALIEELLNFFFVKWKALGLIKRTLVVIQLQPFHRLDNRVDRCRCGSLSVRVLDSKDKLTAVMACEKVIKQRRACPTDVKITRW